MSATVENSSSSRLRLLATLGDALRRLFNQTKSNTIIVGADAKVRLLALELAASRKRVSLIELNDQALSGSVFSPEWLVVNSSAPDELVLERAGAKEACCLVATTPNNDLNLKLCRAD